MLTLAVEAGSQAVDREALTDRIAVQGQNLSTQEATWALLATNALIDRPGADGITLDGKPAEGPLVRVLDAGAVTPVVVKNDGADTTVTVTTYGASQIYVGGEVRTPGVVQIRGEMNTAQAIVAAGGFAETAGAGTVIVLRRVENGRLAMRTVDAGRLIRADERQDFLLHPGDLVFVPRSRIAEVNLFVRQYLNGVLPFNFGFSYDLNRFR